MSDGNSSGNSSVGIVAILAILVLVGVAAWFVWGRPGRTRVAETTTTSQPAQTDVQVKINLPDSVTIK
jgi:hypothetical protein